MIRYKVRELIALRQFKTGARITILDVAGATGIHRTTLSKLVNERGYVTGTETIDRLCAYFGCEVGDVMEYVKEGPDSGSVKAQGNRSGAAK